jgi:ADP-ribosylation factor-binding protein GGA
MCEEESDDQEAVAKLFEINDSIHRTIERYKLIKKGDIDGAHQIPHGTLGTSLGVGKGANQELSLIDFDAEGDATQTSGGEPSNVQQQSKPVESLQDDLLGLSFNDQNTSYGQGGLIALGLGTQQSKFWSRSTHP